MALSSTWRSQSAVSVDNEEPIDSNHTRLNCEPQAQSAQTTTETTTGDISKSEPISARRKTPSVIGLVQSEVI
jgi:hypothetical protein